MYQGLVIALALVAPFMMPWPFAVVLGVGASYFLPSIALVIGVIFEFMYGTSAIPYALIAGVVVFGVMHGVRHFVKTRIMGA